MTGTIFRGNKSIHADRLFFMPKKEDEVNEHEFS